MNFASLRILRSYSWKTQERRDIFTHRLSQRQRLELEIFMQQQRETQADGKDLATETLVRKTSQDINTKKQTVTCSFFVFFATMTILDLMAPVFDQFFVCCFLCCIAWHGRSQSIHELSCRKKPPSQRGNHHVKCQKKCLKCM